MGILLKRGETYYYQFRRGGRQIQRSLRTKDKDHAEKLFHIYESKKAANNGISTAPAKLEIDVGFFRFLEAKRTTLRPRGFIEYSAKLDVFSNWLKNRNISFWHQLSDELIVEFVADRQRLQLAPKTIYNEVSLLRTVVLWLYRNNLLQENPVRAWPRLKTTSPTPEKLGYYTADEVNQLREYFRFREFESVFTFAIYTGARREEIRAAQVGDINLKSGIMNIRCLKTGTTTSNQIRRLKIHPDLIKVLEDRCTKRKADEPLFPEMTRHSRNWPTREIEKACRKLNILYRRFHGLRHTVASHLLDAGVDLMTVMNTMGWTRLETAQKYLHQIKSGADPSLLPY